MENGLNNGSRFALAIVNAHTDHRLVFYLQGVNLVDRVYKKMQPRNFPRNPLLQFLSIKAFRPLGIEIELLIQCV
jgi:hypothetical protein